MKIASGTVDMAAYGSYEKSTSLKTVTESSRTSGNGTVKTVSASVTDTYEYRATASRAGYSLVQGENPQLERGDNNPDSTGINKSKTKASAPQVADAQGKEKSKGRTIAELVESIQNAAKPAVMTELPDVSDDPRLAMLRNMLELLNRMTGKKGQNSFKPLNGIQKINVNTQAATAADVINSGPLGNGNVWTVKKTVSGFVSGEEHLAFSSQGRAMTEDGREISFNVSMEMSRSFATAIEAQSSVETYTVMDPLVINVGAETASVSDAKFYFDLDSDGREEEMSALGGGCGFLALDKNGDGSINNGSELFGARTGDGFSELAAYDDDGNGWIDENDRVFNSLSVWYKNEDGTDSLVALSKAGVGAIFLGKAAGEFALTDSSGNESAFVRSTGVFLHESGASGTIQHVDFKV